MFSLNTLLYMATSIIGVILVHIALDNISKFLKEGLLKDRFNFENESFEQCKDLQTNDYSVNIPCATIIRVSLERDGKTLSIPLEAHG